MQTVLIVIHFLIVIILVGGVLIQPSEGGGLGVGGGSGFMSTRGTKNTLTRLTAILAICFFVTSIALVVVGNISNSSLEILNRIPVNSEQNSTNKNAPEGVLSPGNGTQPSILEQLGGASTFSREQKGSADSATDNPIPPPVKSLNSDSKTR
ncbi:preprotein translocase subunit SecG [Bartonella bacilliformis]|uniref:Protein-export membrane protein SecG n=1 Tax=Bartonella bacilliformis Ver097 TaxID=1293911 RepID=A0A072R2P2_BARBA|nr:preprotein translocase subunit SecG [Bartonella bacilliformis]KEG20040.1 preprotein translocase, SecG subunit [Bartonella bacilliformis Ver097]